MSGPFFSALAALLAASAVKIPLRPLWSISLGSLLGAAFFFWGGRPTITPHWRRALSLASLSCLIAGIPYYLLLYHPDLALTPTRLRYASWLVSGPLLCTQFYLLLRPWGASGWALGRLVLAHSWLVGFGYVGEVAGLYWILLWGAVASLGFVSLLHEVWFGSLARLVDTVPDPLVGRAYTYLSSFLLVSWLLYPLGYMSQPLQVLARLPVNRDLLYSLADVVNQVGCGSILYGMARRAARSR